MNPLYMHLQPDDPVSAQATLTVAGDVVSPGALSAPSERSHLHGRRCTIEINGNHPFRFANADRLWLLYRRLIEQSPEAYFITTCFGEILDCNQAACAFLDSPLDELIGCSLPCLINPEKFELMEAELGEMITACRYERSHIRINPPGRQGFRASVSVELLAHLEDSTILLWTLRDESRIECAQAQKERTNLIADAAKRAEQSKHEAVQAERARLANEIHDTLAQSFTAIALNLDAAMSALAGGSDSAQDLISRARDIAQDGLTSARRSIWELRPRELELGDLCLALRRIAGQKSVAGRIDVRFKEAGTRTLLPPQAEIALLRIGQEALNNALMHSRASRIRIELKWNSHNVLLRVIDNGAGIDNLKSPLGGYGMIGMRDRADSLGGRLLVRSRTGRGTCVFVRIPVCPQN